VANIKISTSGCSLPKSTLLSGLLDTVHSLTLCHTTVLGRAIAQAVSRQIRTAVARVQAQVGHVRFVMDKVALGQDFSQYFYFPCQFSFHRLLHIHHHLSSGTGTIGQLVADVPSELSPTPPQETKKSPGC
jgi:hypothetical protein